MNKTIQFKDLGIIDYNLAWEYQEELFKKILNIKTGMRLQSHPKKMETPNYLLFCEHLHVYTLGKSGSENNLLINMLDLKKINATYYKINRGGDITYHGPGQIVAYPIIDLENFNLDIRAYIYCLEEAVIKTLKTFNIIGERLEGATGVWLGVGSEKARKICAIGVKASRYVTMHGLAFNINTDLSYFNYINPCGFIDKSVSSLHKEINGFVPIDEVKNILKENLVKEFGGVLV